MEFHFARLDSDYRDFRNPLDFSRNIGCPPRACQRVDFTHEFDYSGNRLIAAPKFSIAAAVDYSLPLPNFQGRDMGYLTPRFSLTWKDSIYFDACSGRGAMCNFPTGTFGEDAVLLMHASLGGGADERFQILLWVQNLTDQIYLNQSFDQSGAGMQNILEIYGELRPSASRLASTLERRSGASRWPGVDAAGHDRFWPRRQFATKRVEFMSLKTAFDWRCFILWAPRDRTRHGKFFSRTLR